MLDLIQALVFIQLTAEECLGSSKRKPQDCRESKWLLPQRLTSDEDEANWRLLLIFPRESLTLKHCSWATEVLWWVFYHQHGTHHTLGILSSLLDTNKREWVCSKLQAFTLPPTNLVWTNCLPASYDGWFKDPWQQTRPKLNNDFSFFHSTLWGQEKVGE